MTESEPHPDADPSPSSDRDLEHQPSAAPPDQSEGPGCMPAVLAGGLILMMAFFVCCGVSTTYLWNQRGDMAVRTLRGHTMPMIEQSQLPPEEKQAINASLETVAEQIMAEKLENWQVSGIMTRLQRLPIIEWADLAAVEAMVQASDDWTADEKEEIATEFARLRHAVAIGQATRLDLYDVVEPVRRDAPQSASGTQLVSSPTRQQVGEVVKRARLVSERLEIDDQATSDVSLSTIVRQQIESGRTKGDP